MILGHGGASSGSSVLAKNLRAILSSAKVLNLIANVGSHTKTSELGLVQFAMAFCNVVSAGVACLVGIVPGLAARLGRALLAKALGKNDCGEAFFAGFNDAFRVTVTAITTAPGVAILVVDSAANYASGVTQCVLAGSLGLVG